MLITPDRGKQIFGLLMILAGLAMTAGSLRESLRARSRTSVTEAQVLASFKTFMGIGPLRHEAINVRYEFFVNGVRFEKNQLVDNLPGGPVYVQFDPTQPQNNGLALSNSAPEFLGVTAGLLLIIGLGLALNVWKRLTARSRSAGDAQTSKTS